MLCKVYADGVTRDAAAGMLTTANRSVLKARHVIMSRRRRSGVPAAHADREKGREAEEQAERPGGQGTGGGSVVVDGRPNGRPRVKTRVGAATAGVIGTSTSSSGSKQHQRPVLQHR